MSQINGNSQNLTLISIFHYVLAAMIYLKGCFAFVMMMIGTIAVMGVLHDQPHDMEVALVVLGLIFFAGPLVFMLLCFALATMVLLAGKRISQRMNLQFCQIIAGLECLCVPFGTILGVFTLMHLTKDETKEEFESPAE